MQIKPETIVAGFGIFLALWYLAASIYNRRRGIAVYRWLHSGLEDLGGEVSGRWIGSSGSGAELHVFGANPPFRELQIIYLLASRELLPLFLVDLLRGKRDRVIIKATLKANPDAELEIAREGSGLARQMRAEKNRPWTIAEGPGGFVIGGRGGSEPLRAATLPLLEKYAAQVNHISWAKKAPHLIAILSLEGLFQAGGGASGLYADIAAAAGAAHPARS
jgi:hypothetical protein